MRPGDIVEVTKDEHEGEVAVIRGASGYYFHLGKVDDQHVETKEYFSVHRSAIKVVKPVDNS